MSDYQCPSCGGYCGHVCDNGNKVFERVIAEQQERIDALEAQNAARDSGLVRHHAKLDKFIANVFSHLNTPTDKTFLVIKEDLLGFNYCLTCEQSPCECEGQYG